MTIQDPRPRYAQVADVLRAEIRSGVWSPGERLPSQPELARRFDLSQTSIARAMEVLRAEGMIRSEFGGGSFVLDAPATKRVRAIPKSFEAGTPSGFAAQMRAAGLEPRTTLSVAGPVEAPAGIAARLGLDGADQVMVRTRRMFADDRPVQLATSYIPWRIAEGLQPAEVETNPAGLYTLLRDRGHGPVLFAEEIEGRRPTPEEAAFLSIPEAQFVFEVTRIATGADGRPVEVCVNVLNLSQWRLRYEWEGDNA
ncbi:GntR family transcriptional regulator [Streptosporangium sp. NPDC001559]|uniref:GntR family transcriptional regulator n=1 Tax=Streptosporangium sp. NPDC001559 TaxID=3366187 RepID=UPI0036E9A4C3